MDIVFNIDNGYLMHMCVTMLSILDTNKDESICFHIVTLDLNRENRIYVKHLATKHGASIKFYDVDASTLNDYPIGESTGNTNLTLAAYLRLFIPDLLPETIEKVLYLDSDIVVINSLKDLWHTDISNYSIGTVTDYGMAQEKGAKRMGLEDGYKYFNSGVMLMNLKKLREIQFTSLVENYMHTDGYRILMHDQDILNGLLYKDRFTLDTRWNMMCNTDNTTDYTIIHFAGIKPWYIDCPHPLKHLYYKYLDLTIFRDKPHKYYYSRVHRLKMFIKKYILHK